MFDLRDPSFGDAHPVGDLLLGEVARPTDLGEPVAYRDREELLLTGPHSLLAAGTGDLLASDVGPPYMYSCSVLLHGAFLQVDLVPLFSSASGIASSYQTFHRPALSPATSRTLERHRSKADAVATVLLETRDAADAAH